MKINSKFQNLITWISIIGSICSSLGVGVLSYFINNDNAPIIQALLYAAVVILIIFALLLISIILNKSEMIGTKDREINGYLVEHSDRNKYSMSFARTAMSSIDIFGGDLTWLEADLSIYSELIRKKNIKVRVLTDNRNATVIPQAKVAGLIFVEYSAGQKAPFIASMFDLSNVSQSRVLVINKVALKFDQKGDHYNYWFKEYGGEKDKTVIKSFKTLFEHYYSAGKQI